MSFFDRHGIIDPRSETVARVSEMQELGTFENTRLIGPHFGTASVTDTNFWTLTTTAAATASAENINNVIVLNPGESSASLAQVVSVRKARFMFANPNLWRGLIRADSANPGQQIFGALDLGSWSWGSGNLVFNGGFYFRINGRQLTINYRDGATYYALGNPADSVAATTGILNGETVEYTVDDNYHAYEIQYFMAKARFYVDGVLIGTLTPTTAPFNVLQLNAAAVSYNVSGGFYPGGYTAPLRVAAMSILRMGKEHSLPAWKFYTGTAALLKRGAGTLHHITVTDNSGSAFSIYDSLTSGTNTITTIDPAKTTGTLNFGVEFENGLYVGAASTGSPKITFLYE